MFAAARSKKLCLGFFDCNPSPFLLDQFLFLGTVGSQLCLTSSKGGIAVGQCDAAGGAWEFTEDFGECLDQLVGFWHFCGLGCLSMGRPAT